MSARTALSLLLLMVLAAPASAQGPGAVTTFEATSNNSGFGFNAKLFAPRSGYIFPDGNQWHIGDFDLDGKADLFHVPERGNHVETWFSNGDGTFRVETFTPPQYPFREGHWLVGDLDGNGRADLVHQAKRFLATWRTIGNGQFAIAHAPHAIPDGRWLSGDFDGDRDMDLVRLVDRSNRVDVWKSDGNGGFAVSPFSPSPGYAVINGLWLTGRINNDDRDDLVHLVWKTNLFHSDYAHIWLAKTDGTFDVGYFRPWKDYPMPQATLVLVPIVNRFEVVGRNDRGKWLTADLNGDGLTDIFHAVAGDEHVHVWFSNGHTGFAQNFFSLVKFRVGGGYRYHDDDHWLAGDVDGDTRSDLMRFAKGADHIQVWLSQPTGGFAIGTARAWNGYPMGGNVWRAGNFAGDNRIDLLHVYPMSPARPLKVLRHAGAPLPDGDAERILTDMTEVLFRNDNPADRTCSVRFTLDGPVGTFAQSDGVILNEDDYLSVINVPGRVKVVNQIQWCGGTTARTGIAGCGDMPGNSLIVTRTEAGQEGALWAHEYGHNKGLDHRDDPSAIMSAFLGATQRGVSPDECALSVR